MILKMFNAALGSFVNLPNLLISVAVIGFSLLGFVKGSPTFAFQYQCYRTDVCSYPEQYCDSKLERCLECDGMCDRQTRTLPLGCQAFCTKESEESSVGSSWLEHRGWFYLSVGLAIVVIFVSIKNGIKWREKRNNRPEAGTSETEALDPDSETHDSGTASEMDSMTSNGSTISPHVGGASYCKVKLKNVQPTNKPDEKATSMVVTSGSTYNVKGSNEGKHDEPSSNTAQKEVQSEATNEVSTTRNEGGDAANSRATA